LRGEVGLLGSAFARLSNPGEGLLGFALVDKCPSPQPSFALGLALDTRNLDMIQAWDEDSP
jgi:hypothetical protein